MFDDINDILKKKSVEAKSVALTPKQAISKIIYNTGYNNFVQLANDLEIKDHQKAKQAVDMSIQLKTMQKEIEKVRKNITEPYLRFQKILKKESDLLVESLEEVAKKIRLKLEAYYDKIKLENLSTNSLLKIGELKIDSSEGKAYQKQNWKFEITDIEKVPREFLEVNEVKLKKSIASGIRQIDGINIFCEIETKFRAKKTEKQELLLEE